MLAASDTAAQLEQITESMSNWIWWEPTFFLLLGAGLLFTIISKFVQWRIVAHGFACIRGDYDKPGDTGHINHFQALAAALSATIGLGNIAGVALAVSLGGPGAVFWMWIVGLFGMALKFMECTLAVMFRDVREGPDPGELHLSKDQPEGESTAATSADNREVRGGPMWYVQKALVDPLKAKGNPAWVVFRVLAILFAAATILNSVGSGNMFQGWNVSNVLEKNFGVHVYVSAVIVSSLVALVIIGGIKRIGQVAAKLVPFMCVIYVAAATYVILTHISEVPYYLSLIVRSAFTPQAEGGAFAGAAVWLAFKTGMIRACFSNEAGEGSAAMAHAAAKTEEPIREGVVAGIGPLIDTLVICTMSALVLLMSGTWNRDPLARVVAVDEQSVQIEFNRDIPPRFADRYLDHLTHPEVTGAELAIHTARGVGVDLDTVTIDIPKDAVANDETGNVAWSDLATLTLSLEDESEDDRTALEVGQPVHLDMQGAELTRLAFDTTLAGMGAWIVSIGVCLFAFSTMISWSYYGEKGAEYLLGPTAILPYKFVFVIFVFLGMVLEKFQWVYNFSDATVGLMVICNLPAVLILSPHVLRAAKDYFRRLDGGQMPKRTQQPDR